MVTSEGSQSYLAGYVDLEELTQAVGGPTRIILVIRASDGEVEQVHAVGGTVVQAVDPNVSEKASWFWKDGCVYAIDQNGAWQKVCGDGRMVLQILVADGSLERVTGPTQPASHPGVPPKAGWRWKTSSPGCVYVQHFGVWKKVCD
jgi:hypothetical protein